MATTVLDDDEFVQKAKIEIEQAVWSFLNDPNGMNLSAISVSLMNYQDEWCGAASRALALLRIKEKTGDG